MKTVRNIQIQTENKEELFPDFTDTFPYTATRAELHRYPGRIAPWHWHQSVELFYMESGELEYSTPGGTIRFPAGSGGMVNSEVLHMTKTLSRTGETIQLLHIFHPALLAGERGSRIDSRYISPLTRSQQIQLIPLFPENPEHQKILDLLRTSFQISDSLFGYELLLREALSQIWLLLLQQAQPLLEQESAPGKSSGQIKAMMTYIHEHYPEHISIRNLASSAFLSERACFRMFRETLHMTPNEYITSYRLQRACRLLETGQDSITDISRACGLGSSSYFGKVFREQFRCTPSDYRRNWQDREKMRP
ncbi:MAG: AraC family transcriptional regulator [Eubacteriales bacterium]|nr:AraC family transcriptional regulator [Eubacteriales bacterium]